MARRTIETGGENLVQGLSNMLEDLERGQGRLRVRMTDLEKFKLGENVAVTPGKVVFENDLMQLLQYAPTTESVRRRPLLVIPPWINKYYILDLRPKNSFIRWAVDQGHTVFVISWVNPDERLAEKTMDDYLLDGPVAALDAVGKATGEDGVNAIGYCLGGTLLAATLAYLKAREATAPADPSDAGGAGDTEESGNTAQASENDRAAESDAGVNAAGHAEDSGPATDSRPVIESATFFTTMVDFEEPGELGVFIDEEQLALVEESMKEKGYFDGAKMAEAFNLLRANDLILELRDQQLPHGQGSVPVRPPVLELGLDPHAARDGIPRTCARCTSTTVCASRAASPWTACPSTSPPSTCRRTSSPPARTTSRRGSRRTRQPDSTVDRFDSFSRCPATSRGS